MKRLNRALWLALIALPAMMLLAGCDKFLDRKPLAATLEDLNQGGLEGQIYGLYGAIRNGDVAGQGFGGIPWQGVQNFRSDDTEKGSSAADGADWGVLYDGFQYAKDHWSSNTYWDQHYALITLANTAIQTADSLKLSAASDKINIAEARFFRGYAYFDLVRAFGQVPKIDFRIYNPNDSKKPKASIAEIYALIDADMQYAAANLPANWKNAAGQSRFPGRLTSGAARGILAKAQLYRKNWSGALSLCQQIMASGEYALLSDFATVFTDAGENGSESLWEIQASVGAGGADEYYSWYGICQGVRGAGEWDLGWGWNAPVESMVTAWDDSDPRKKASVLFSGQNDGVYGKTLPVFPDIPRKFWNKKVYPSPAQQLFTGQRQGGWINQRMLRYSDVILMAAEAANEIGGTANAALAVNYLEMVRARARGTNAVLPKIEFSTQAQMRTAIQNDRRWELAFEGERFYDLVRWDLALSILGGQGYQARHRYLPLPQPAIDFAGGVLVQNPDYP